MPIAEELFACASGKWDYSISLESSVAQTSRCLEPVFRQLFIISNRRASHYLQVIRRAWAETLGER